MTVGESAVPGVRHIAIVGGGIGGLTAALCLAQRGFAVTVLERARAFGEIGAGIQLSPNATRVLAALSLTPALEARAFRPAGTELRDWRSGDIITKNMLGRDILRTYGFPYCHIHRADLVAVLAAAAGADPAITLKTGVRVDHVTDEGPRVRLEGPELDLDADLAVGADGIHSILRRHLFGPDNPRFTGNIAWRGLIPAERLPEGLVRPVSTGWLGPGSHFVHYFVRGGDLVNCACVVEKPGSMRESWTEPGDHRELGHAFDGWHGQIMTLIDAIDRNRLFKWALFDRPPMPGWSRGRITLLGDACHPTLPFMAQGAAMAMEDGAVLARHLADGGSLARALLGYEEERRPRTTRVQEASRRNAKVYHLTGPEAVERNRAMAEARGRTLDWLYRYDATTGSDHRPATEAGA